MPDSASRSNRDERQSYDRFPRRHIVPSSDSFKGTLFDNAIRAVFPWHRVEYPGLIRGMRQLFGQHYSTEILNQWRGKGEGQEGAPPATICRVLAGYLRGRAGLMSMLANDLEAYAARSEARKVKHLQGRPRSRVTGRIGKAE